MMAVESEDGYRVILTEEDILEVVRTHPKGVPREDLHIHFASVRQMWGEWELDMILYPPAGAPA